MIEEGGAAIFRENEQMERRKEISKWLYHKKVEGDEEGRGKKYAGVW